MATQEPAKRTEALALPAFEFQSLDNFVQQPKITNVIGGIIPAQSIAVVFGPPKGGKTFSVADLTMHAAHGMDWHGQRIKNRARVAYLAGEGVNGFRVRLKVWLEHHDNIEEPGDFRILPSILSLPDTAFALIESLREFKPDIVVIDTLNAYFGGGDENSTQDMSTFCAALRYMRDELLCAVLVIHHTGHGDSGRERGSIVLRATADVLIQVAKDETRSELIGFQVIAARDLEPMAEPIALRLQQHKTEWQDDEGEPVVSCVVLAAEQPVTLPGRGGRPLGEAQAKVLAAAQELARKQVPDASGEVLLSRVDVAALAKERGVKKQSVNSTWEPLHRRGRLRLLEPGSIAIRVRTSAHAPLL